MSLLWGYESQKCDGEYCPNDCDRCYKADKSMEDIEDIKSDRPISQILERIAQTKAKPAEECAYPRCEECDKYHGHYCTVPIVFSKQASLMLDDFMGKTNQRLTELEKLVTDEILGEKPKATEDPNMTWEDFFKGEYEVLDV